jgi:hypothetical protein
MGRWLRRHLAGGLGHRHCPLAADPARRFSMRPKISIVRYSFRANGWVPNATHASATDPNAKFIRKGNRDAKLSYRGDVLMENRHGLFVDLQDHLGANHRNQSGLREPYCRCSRPRSAPKTEKRAVGAAGAGGNRLCRPAGACFSALRNRASACHCRQMLVEKQIQLMRSADHGCRRNAPLRSFQTLALRQKFKPSRCGRLCL